MKITKTNKIKKGGHATIHFQHHGLSKAQLLTLGLLLSDILDDWGFTTIAIVEKGKIKNDKT